MINGSENNTDDEVILTNRKMFHHHPSSILSKDAIISEILNDMDRELSEKARENGIPEKVIEERLNMITKVDERSIVMSEKKLNFVVRDDGIEADVITGGVKTTIRYIQTYLNGELFGIEDGEELTVTIKRHDVTDEESDIAPEY